MNESHRRAVELARFYFRRLAECAGADWDPDNDTEIEILVDLIIDAAAAGLAARLASELQANGHAPV